MRRRRCGGGGAGAFRSIAPERSQWATAEDLLRIRAVAPAPVLPFQPDHACARRPGRLLRHARALALGTALLTGGIGVAAPAAWAGPYVYIDSFVVSDSQESCLARMRSYLLEAGLTASVARSMATDSKGNQYQEGWDADHPDKNIGATTECDAKDGTGAIAVAGMNNDETFKVYQKLPRLIFK